MKTTTNETTKTEADLANERLDAMMTESEKEFWKEVTEQELKGK